MLALFSLGGNKFNKLLTVLETIDCYVGVDYLTRIVSLYFIVYNSAKNLQRKQIMEVRLKVS